MATVDCYYAQMHRRPRSSPHQMITASILMSMNTWLIDESCARSRYYSGIRGPIEVLSSSLYSASSKATDRRTLRLSTFERPKECPHLEHQLYPILMFFQRQ